MNPILILRTEIVSLLLLIYLTVVSRTFRMDKDGRTFNLIMTFAMLHVIMDGFTVWTVNHPEVTPRWVNDMAHIVFYGSAVLFSTEILTYTANLCFPDKAKNIRYAATALALVYLGLAATGVLRIEYTAYNGTNSSTGSAPTTGFILCFIFFAAAICMILLSRNRVGKHLRLLLLPMLFLLILVEIVQLFVKEFLFTGATATVICVGFFLSLENPAAVMEKKIMRDALSGLGSRSSYERDMQEYDGEFQKDKSLHFTFVFIDISNLRSINGLFGQKEGDAYIGRIATLLVSNLRNAEHIYRMGGDEFLAVYHKTDEKTVVRDIQRMQDACDREEKSAGYRPQLAVGYAVSDPKYNSLRDVLRVADYMMYRNKTAQKREVVESAFRGNGTRLNLYGLTDRVFDAMCLTSEEFYPYITNLETGVTRVAPGMAEFFGLEGEFIQNFNEVWMEKIHPSDRDKAGQDIRLTLKGLKEYHYYRYRVLGRDGKYVEVTCRGGVYHGRDGEPDIFSGYIVNHGAPKTRDPETGLMNERQLQDRLREIIGKGEKAVVLRLNIRNMGRIRMLYGNSDVTGALSVMADLCLRAVKDRGEVFIGSSRGFVFVLPGGDRGQAEEIFWQVREACAGGIIVGDRVIPISVHAGAIELPMENVKAPEEVRSAMLFIMEEAGPGGKNTVAFYTGGSADMREEDAALLQEVHRSCLADRERFFLRLQPIVDAQTGKILAAEALLRYRDNAGKEVPPGRFITFLESDPGYTDLGYHILRTALRHARRIREKLPDFNINVNITALQLYEENFIPQALQILREEDYPAEHLILELTERCKEMEFDFLKQRVSELRRAGFRVALDDMGTGYSTIDLLLHLDVNEIKLDMTFTQHMRENEKDQKFAEMLAKMTQDDDVLLCFEGVETEEMRGYLRRFGRCLLQGYYFDKPLKPEEFEAKYC